MKGVFIGDIYPSRYSSWMKATLPTTLLSVGLMLLIPSIFLNVSAGNTIKYVVTATTTPLGLYVTKQATATVFWVGESASEENEFISNDMSAWDSSWEMHYGGYDDPTDRCGYLPCTFIPKENPFYVALPYNNFNEDGTVKPSSNLVPWYAEKSTTTLLKNTWVQIQRGGASCYGQWQDSGPNQYDDFAYVFGIAREPVNTFNTRAGIDISPALRDCLKAADVSSVEWNFITEEMVPDGPWKERVTTSTIYWE